MSYSHPGGRAELDGAALPDLPGAQLFAGNTGPPDRGALFLGQEPKGNCRGRGRCQKLGERKYQERIDSDAGIFERKLSASTELYPSYSHGI